MTSLSRRWTSGPTHCPLRIIALTYKLPNFRFDPICQFNLYIMQCYELLNIFCDVTKGAILRRIQLMNCILSATCLYSHPLFLGQLYARLPGELMIVREDTPAFKESIYEGMLVSGNKAMATMIYEWTSRDQPKVSRHTHCNALQRKKAHRNIPMKSSF